MDLFKPVKPTILVVDDAPANLALIAGILQDLYTVKVVNHGHRAIKLVHEDPPDLILLDIGMPDMDGYEVCRYLKSQAHSSQIPIIFLTSRTDTKSEQMGMELGAVDYVSRPFSRQVLVSRVRAHLVDAMHAKTLRINNEYLEYEVKKRSNQLLALQDVTILAMASLAETRDNDTGNHLRRTQHYIRLLGEQLMSHPRFSAFLSRDVVRTLYKCAPLHDIGKVGIPDAVLLKPGRLDAEELAVMRRHPELGRNAILSAQETTGEEVAFLEIALDIVYSHHEKWDGTGYPEGLVGDAIPIAARLMALADVYDALISERVYKSGYSHERASEIIAEGRGSHFDPEVVDAFFAVREDFKRIAQRFADRGLAP